MSNLNSRDINIDDLHRQSKAPPGGQSSIFLGDYAPYVPKHAQSPSRPTSSYNFGGNDSQHTPNPRQYKEPQGNDIFGNHESSAPVVTSPQRTQQKQTFDVFNNDSEYDDNRPTTGRRFLSCPEQVDIFGREAVPVQQPSRRPIQQPNSNIFEGNRSHVTDYRSHASTVQQQLWDESNKNPPAAGSRTQYTSSVASMVGHNVQNSHVDSDQNHPHRRLSSASNQSTDVFGNRPNEYRESTDYQTSSYQAPPPANSNQGYTRRADTTQSLASVLSGGGGGGGRQQSRPNTSNSLQVGSMSSQQDLNYGGRRSSNAGKSSLVLN